MRFGFILLLVLFSNNVLAWGLKELGDEAASPITTKARDILIIGSAVTLVSIIFEDNVDPVHDEVVNDRPLGDFSRFGDLAGQMVPNITYMLGQGVAALSGDEKGMSRATGMFKATAYAASVTTALKYTIREPRPDNHKDRNSFPSGHTTTAFAFGGYIFEEHGWKWGVPALAISTFSGLSRVNDNRHRLHDVLAGATIGLAYGVGIVKLGKKNKDGNVSFNLIPMYDEEVKGILLVKSF